MKLSFFPTTSISFILIGIGTLPISAESSEILWGLGAAIHLAFTLYVMNVWINQQHFQIKHMNRNLSPDYPVHRFNHADHPNNHQHETKRNMHK